MKDTDFLSISARVRAMENKLLTKERAARMIDARSDDEVAKLLAECGYAEPEDLSPAGVNAMLSAQREELFRDLGANLPNQGLMDVFRIPYDYHNAKTLLKAEAMGEQAERLLMTGGRYDPLKLAEDFRRGELTACSEPFRNAVREGRATLAETRDPRRLDLILDRACYGEMTHAAQRSESPFLQGYVRLSIDAINLRTAVRCARMRASGDLLRESLLPGGNIAPRPIAAARAGELAQPFAVTPLEEAAKLGESLVSGGSLTKLENACNRALDGYLSSARRVAFGEQPVVAYLCQRQSEANVIRAILTGRRAGLTGDAIRERLGDLDG